MFYEEEVRTGSSQRGKIKQKIEKKEGRWEGAEKGRGMQMECKIPRMFVCMCRLPMYVVQVCMCVHARMSVRTCGYV